MFSGQKRQKNVRITMKKEYQYFPLWINKNWGRKNGFKGKTKRHTVDYDRKRNPRYVRLEGEFDREDLMKLIFELETNYAIEGIFTDKANKAILEKGFSPFGEAYEKYYR